MAVPPWRGPFDVVAIATSLGGPHALMTLLAELPGDFPAAIVIAQHRLADPTSRLETLLQQRTALPVMAVERGTLLLPGAIYLAPADRHLLVEAGRSLLLSTAAPVQFARPSANLLFASVAEVYRTRAIGVVLTGKQTDGALGAWAIKAMGGRVLVQDPVTCAAPDMPDAAIRSGCVDFVLPLPGIAAALVALVMGPGVAPLFQVPMAASLARARQRWIA
jgi:two-component system chemotaxis response regulator CheB